MSDPNQVSRGDAEPRSDEANEAFLRDPAPPREIEYNSRGDAEPRSDEDDEAFLRAPAPPREIYEYVSRGDAEPRRDEDNETFLRAPAPPREIFEYVSRGDAETRSDDENMAFLRDPAPPREFEYDGITGTIIDAAIQLHRDIGPGLLESVYETILARMLERRGLHVERQKRVVFEYDGMRFDEGLRLDLLVDGCVVVELKSVEALAPVHNKQVLTYLKLLHLPVGLLINFGGATLKQGLRRIVNDFPGASSSLRVNAASRGDAETRRDSIENSTLRAPAPPRELEIDRTRRRGGAEEEEANDER